MAFQPVAQTHRDDACARCGRVSHWKEDCPGTHVGGGSHERDQVNSQHSEELDRVMVEAERSAATQTNHVPRTSSPPLRPRASVRKAEESPTVTPKSLFTRIKSMLLTHLGPHAECQRCGFSNHGTENCYARRHAHGQLLNEPRVHPLPAPAMRQVCFSSKRSIELKQSYCSHRLATCCSLRAHTSTSARRLTWTSALHSTVQAEAVLGQER